MECRPFVQSDFAEYRRWFEDEPLNEQLGPMDEDWLAHVMADQEGQQLSVLRGGELVAVGGVCNATAECPFWTITDIAVHPDLRQQGIGHCVVAGLLALPQFRQPVCWQAQVMPDNPAARRFFVGLGWHCVAEPKVEDEMYSYAWSPAG